MSELPPPAPVPRPPYRRSPYGPLLFGRFRDAFPAALTLADLMTAVAGTGARVSDVASWLAKAAAGGVLEDVGYVAGADGRPTGSRRYRLAEHMLQADRRAQRVG